MSANSLAIVRIRDASLTDAGALVEMFDSPAISDDGTAAGRLRAILDATEHCIIPGFQFHIEFGDTGFKRLFQDRWPKSSNQVGHFLTAVGLSFNPRKMNQSFLGRRMRDWLGAAATLTDEEVAMRLCIGHEKVADSPIGGPFAFPSIRKQFAAANDNDLQIFRRAGAILGFRSPLRLRAAATALSGIAVNPAGLGNSYEDLLLTLCGWRLGAMIRNDKFQNRAAIATWLRENIGS